MKQNQKALGRSASLLSVAVAVACAQWAVPAMAQDDEGPDIIELTVTGSRIARNVETYTGAMSIVEEDFIEAIPSYSLNDMLLKVPAIGLQGTSRNNANGGRGANFTDIHNLETERTLVLMNGRRMISTIRDGSGLGVDMQGFPINMLDRVEVLADGASAIYGSDAVAGVVNVITKRDFSGIEFSGGLGSPSDDGGDTWNFGMLVGDTFDRGFFLAGVTVMDSDHVDYQDRDWSAVPILGWLDLGTGSPVPLMGSGIPPEGRYSGNDIDIIFKRDPTTGANYQDYDTFGFSGLNGSAGDGSLQSILDTGHRFNYNDVGGGGSSLIAPARVINGGFIGEYELDNGVTAYTEMLTQHREGTLWFTPLPLSGAAGRFTDLVRVPFSNPNIPADIRAAIEADVFSADPTATSFLMTYRVSDLGARKYDYDADTLKGTFGLKGDFGMGGKEWNWDAFITAGRSQLDETTENQVNVNNIQIALDPARCAIDAACPKDALGNPTLNIFGLSPKSAAEKAYVLYTDQEETEYQMVHTGFLVSTNDLFTAPGGAAGFAAGIEFRDESGSTQPSAIVTSGDSGGNFSSPTDGSFDVWETFVELDVPLITGAAMAEEVSVQTAVRYSDYDVSGSETTWKVGGRWTINEQVAFRGQVSTGFRAPNILELFGGTNDSFTAVTDPCNTVIQATNPTIAANCASQGVPADWTQPASQLKVSQGGNPNLKAETSDNISFGVVLTPSFIPNLSVAVDWYDIEIEDAISTPDPVQIITTCYESAGLSAPECDRIGRGPGRDVVRFDLLLENLDRVETSGVDINSSYFVETPLGQLNFDWLVTWLDEMTETTATGAVSQRAGLVTCDVCDFTAYPEWRSYFNAGVDIDENWRANFTWRYIDGMDIEDGIGVEGYTFTTPSISYLDAFVTYETEKTKYMVGVENIADKQPPYVPSSANNTAMVYDYLGRTLFARANVKF